MAHGHILLAFGCLLLTATPAMSYCFEPSFSESPPGAPGSYDKPDVPYCLSGYAYSGKHTCDTWELEAYKDEVSDYIDSLNDYLSQAASFAQLANSYAVEVRAYAECEAEEVSRQHE